MNLLEKIEQTTTFINGKTRIKPQYGIILGSGLGELTNKIEIHDEILFEDIPNFPASTVVGHDGKLIFGYIAEKAVVVSKGRFHYYEGYSMEEVTFPVRIFKTLGASTLIVSNAAGSTNPDFKTGEVMFINDHINLHAEHPLRGKNYDQLGPRFPDMMDAYDKDLLNLAKEIAKELNIKPNEGVYIGLQGPTLETPAEYKYLHIIGGDAVGMSTVPEVIVARHMDMRVFGLSVITDMGYPKDVIKKTTHEIVIEVASKQAPLLAKLVEQLIKRDKE
ncbi:MAG: purine-nucleoside phosphorylase [Chitinophagaceae bacterium]|nr:MAG: purine-nucleoside phosphorylase [Chitinophagaceae bacterium]